ncbi:MAG TPA: hypothetical protein VHU14_06270 [Solirubrobacterales bacterium]|jgi:hypothetical protein|nr:hypothetical protein [Solirubrobacterales bacterium]
MPREADTASHFPLDSERKYDRSDDLAGRVSRALLALTAVLAICLLAVSSAEAGPPTTRVAHAAGEIVPIPAAVPHEEGDMVDSRIVGDLRWIAARFPIYVTDGYSGPLPSGEHVGCDNCHVKGSDHYNGLAVDVVPLHGTSGKCDATWTGITRLAEWAEPVQNQPLPPFRWVGYEGDAGHGCGNHLHLSWNHAPAVRYQLAEWVEVFATGGPAAKQPRNHRPEAKPKAPPGPAGGISTVRSGGLSTHGD